MSTSRNKGNLSSPLERGFFYFMNDNSKFRIQFFSLAVIFVLFDLEVVLFLPVITSGSLGLISLFLILLFVAGTLIVEF